LDLKSRSHVWRYLSPEPPGIALKIKSLDLSENSLKTMPREVFSMTNLKSLYLSKCNMQRTFPINNLEKLLHLKLDHNDLEIDLSDGDGLDRLAALPLSLLQLDLSFNHYIKLPGALFTLINLVELNLQGNRIISIEGIGHLTNLEDLLLDENCLTEVPDEVALLVKLRSISLKSNRIGKYCPLSPQEEQRQASAEALSEKQLYELQHRQSISAGLFTHTSVVSINLMGNIVKKEEVLSFEGVDVFLQRRKLSKDKSFAGGALTDHSIFGLD